MFRVVFTPIFFREGGLDPGIKFPPSPHPPPLITLGPPFSRQQLSRSSFSALFDNLRRRRRRRRCCWINKPSFAQENEPPTELLLLLLLSPVFRQRPRRGLRRRRRTLLNLLYVLTAGIASVQRSHACSGMKEERGEMNYSRIFCFFWGVTRVETLGASSLLLGLAAAAAAATSHSFSLPCFFIIITSSPQFFRRRRLLQRRPKRPRTKTSLVGLRRDAFQTRGWRKSEAGECWKCQEQASARSICRRHGVVRGPAAAVVVPVAVA